MIDILKLTRELQKAGIPITGVEATGSISANLAEDAIIHCQNATLEQIALAEQIKADHDPTDYAALVDEAADNAVRDIPGWATWTESEALAYIDNNPVDKAVIKAMVRMLIALRDKTWPGLNT